LFLEVVRWTGRHWSVTPGTFATANVSILLYNRNHSSRRQILDYNISTNGEKGKDGIASYSVAEGIEVELEVLVGER